MVVEVRPEICDGHLLKWLFAAGMNWLEQHKQQVNNMNVFPVPDGDTGTNMLLTIRKAYQQVSQMDEDHAGLVSEQIARGALTGARGNSGTILSMLLRGFSQAMKGKELMDAQAFAQACQSAVDYAYETVESVMEPVEGTILTVARESAAALQKHAQHESNMKRLLDHMIDAAYTSLDNTPNLLPKLKEAGVVDSGGMGLVYILEGMQRLLDGKPVSTPDIHENGAVPAQQNGHHWEDALIPEDEEGYGYDVQFLMMGQDMDVAQVRKDISAMGWSPLIDGDDSMIKVHIHVHNPGDPLSYAVQSCEGIDDIVVENMQAQYQQYVQQRQERETRERSDTPVEGVAVITVARGDGLSNLFEEYGAARIIEGGQTMNPSTQDFLAAIESLHTDEIIILPNNGNIIMAAEQAASLSGGKQVKVVPSKTVQQGISALISFGDYSEGNLDEVCEAMREGMSHVISAEVTTATRSATIDGVKVSEGQTIGLLNGKLVAADNDINQIVHTLLKKAHTEDYGLVTLFYGKGVSEDDAQALADDLEDTYEDIELEIVYGGQPLYPYLISIE